MKAIIFDFDGVIENTFDMCYQVNKEFDPTITKQKFKEMSMGNYWQSFKEEITSETIKAYERIYREKIEKFIIHPIIKETLEKLSKKYKLFVISSGGEDNIKYYMQKNNVLKYFEKILGRDTHFSKVEKFKMLFDKYNLNSNHCIFITDTLGDIKEANQVKVKTIAVSWGFHSVDILELGKPYKIINKYEELYPSIRILCEIPTPKRSNKI